MFTLKFQTDKHGHNTTVCGLRYDTQYHYPTDSAGHAAFCIVTLYPQTASDVAGIVFQVGGSHPLGFREVYIENLNGKTIDHIGPYECVREVVGMTSAEFHSQPRAVG